MLRFFHPAPFALAALTFAALALAACGRTPPPPPSHPVVPAGSGGELTHLVEHYWDEYQALNPLALPAGAAVRFDAGAGYDISPQFVADSLALERRYLAAVEALPRASRSVDSQLTYDAFKRGRELAVESFTYPSELLPVNPFRSLPIEFAQTATGLAPYAVSGPVDYDAWAARADAYVRWTKQAIDNMRSALRRGYVLPSVLVEEMLPILADLGTDTPDSVFYQPLRAIPATIAGSARSRLADGLASGVRGKILPAYRELHDFLHDEYLPRARASVALSALPLGDAWYAFLIKRETGTAATSQSLHAQGTAEALRLKARMQSLLAETAFTGDAQGYLEAIGKDPAVSFDTPEALLNYYTLRKAETASSLAALFTDPTPADYTLRRLEPFREAHAPPLIYQRPPVTRKSAAAVLFVNAGGMPAQPVTASAARFLMESVPGHHYQLAIQQARASLPRFLRFGGDPAFVGGWGLYAASLGEELGLYRDTESKFTAVLGELQCATGVVIDTGLHALGWSRRQAIDYLKAQSPVSEAAAAVMVDRALSLPAEALACTVGGRRIAALRTLAEQALGARFDIHAFHSELLNHGAIPLDLLESEVKRWLDHQPLSSSDGQAAVIMQRQPSSDGQAAVIMQRQSSSDGQAAMVNQR